jgi:2-phosphosulfolactate phosphatase
LQSSPPANAGRTEAFDRHLPRGERRRDTFRVLGSDLIEALTNCASRRELIAIGYADDFDTAAQVDSSTVVPLLQQGAFISG